MAPYELRVDELDREGLGIECIDVKERDTELLRCHFRDRQRVKLLALDETRNEGDLIGLRLGIQAFGLSRGQQLITYKARREARKKNTTVDDRIDCSHRRTFVPYRILL